MKGSASYATIDGSTNSNTDIRDIELATRNFDSNHNKDKEATTPVLSWSAIEVHSLKPHDKLRKVVQDKISSEAVAFPESSTRILKGVSGQINGGFWAILGESGSGKTTLLNVLSRRLDLLRMASTGESRINGRHYTQHDLKSYAGRSASYFFCFCIDLLIVVLSC